MRIATVLALLTIAVTTHPQVRVAAQVALREPQTTAELALRSAQLHTRARMQDDVTALQVHRPAYPFWRHIFTVPDGQIVFGTATEGRLLASFPVRGEWTRDGVWDDPALASALDGQQLPRDLSARRDEVARLLEPVAGRVIHNATRGLFLQPNERRYGLFLDEWATIYERFGVPAEVGLAQALVESGLNGTARSEARAIGFCQWMLGNWRRLQRLSPHVIEGYNQTTQAPYCAAYLSILSTKYGSFIPALSEHHAGGTNIGRTLINGERLGGVSTRDRYFLGSDFARDLRQMAPGTYRDVYGSYGPRSILYAEMIFGNGANIARIRTEQAQEKVYAMRLPRALSLVEVARRAKVSTDVVRRYNPALTRRAPTNSTVYLPSHVAAVGRDVAFWHRAPSAAYAELLNEFVRLDVSPDEWDSAAFDDVLERFRTRFAAIKTEEGTVMATVLRYAMQDRRMSRQAEILAEFRTSDHVLRLFVQAREQREVFRASTTVATPTD